MPGFINKFFIYNLKNCFKNIVKKINIFIIVIYRYITDNFSAFKIIFGSLDKINLNLTFKQIK